MSEPLDAFSRSFAKAQRLTSEYLAHALKVIGSDNDAIATDLELHIAALEVEIAELRGASGRPPPSGPWRVIEGYGPSSSQPTFWRLEDVRLVNSMADYTGPLIECDDRATADRVRDALNRVAAQSPEETTRG